MIGPLYSCLHTPSVTVANLWYNTNAHPYLGSAAYPPYFDPLTRQPYLDAFPPPQCPFPTPLRPNPQPFHQYPHNFAWFVPGSPQTTWQSFDSCISPFEPLPTMRPPSQPALVQRLPQLPQLESTAPLNPVNPKSNAYPQNFMHSPLTDFVSCILQSPFPTISLDCHFRPNKFTVWSPNTVPPTLIPHTHTGIL